MNVSIKSKTRLPSGFFVRSRECLGKSVHTVIDRLRNFSDESGQTTILAATSMIVLVFFAGLAVDVGNLRLAKRRLQNAADAAVLAATLEARVCTGTSSCTVMQNAAQSALAENGYTGATLVNNCSSAPGSGLTLMLNEPPCFLGSNDPDYGKPAYIEAVVSEQENMYFARLAGFSSMTVTARSEASRPANPPCIYALDPTNAGAISVIAGILINSKCAMVDESSSSAAFACLIGAGITAPSISITGGAAGLLCGGVENLRTGVPVPSPADPLAYLPTPVVGSCGSGSGNVYHGASSQVSIILGGTYVFYPGVYCGGISMTAALAANVTFMPGVYVLKQGPGFLGIPTGGLNITLSLLSNIQGSGVTFYNIGPIGGINITAPATLGLSNFSLTAPTSGTYSGVLFFQDASNTSPGTFIANILGGGKLEGAIYLPSAQVVYGVSALSSAYTVLVAKDINFSVAIGSTFGNNYSALATGSPILANVAVLDQ